MKIAVLFKTCKIKTNLKVVLESSGVMILETGGNTAGRTRNK